MKKYYKMSILSSFLVVLLIFSGCSSSSSTPSNSTSSDPSSSPQNPNSTSSSGTATSDKQITLQFATSFPESDNRSMAQKWWADKVAEATNNHVIIKMHYGQSLVPLSQNYDALSTGIVDIMDFASSYITPNVADLSPLDLLVSHNPDNNLEVDEKIRGLIDEILLPHNIVYLWPLYSGEMIALANKPLTTLDDWKGLRIRGFGHWSSETVELFGGVPQTIPLSEMVVALERGTVDGAFNAWTTARATKQHELVTDVTWFEEYATLWYAVAMSKNSWELLSKEEQEILLDLGNEAAVMARDLSLKTRDEFKRELDAMGKKQHSLTEAQKEEFLQLANETWEMVEKDVGEKGKQLIKELQSLR